MMGFGVEPSTTAGFRTLAEHFMEKHPEAVILHLLYHEQTLPGCTVCAETHELLVKSGQHGG